MAVNLSSEVKQFVVFLLAGETYGVEINRVREIITMQTITKVPGTSEIIEGIINLRGHVIPVVNLRKTFNLTESRQDESQRIIVVDVKENTMGVEVDGVSEVLGIDGRVIEKPSSMVTANITTDYIWGIAKLEDKMIILLDLEKALNIEDLNGLTMIS